MASITFASCTPAAADDVSGERRLAFQAPKVLRAPTVAAGCLRTGARDAFTLVELAAALTVFSLLMVALTRVMVSLHATERATAAVASAPAKEPLWIRRAQRLLEADVAGGRGVVASDEGVLLQVTSPAAAVPAGDDKAAGDGPPRLPPVEPARVVWRYEPAPIGSPSDEGRLVRDVLPLLDRSAGGGREETLAFGVEAASVVRQFSAQAAAGFAASGALAEEMSLELRLSVRDAAHRELRRFTLSVGPPRSTDAEEEAR